MLVINITTEAENAQGGIVTETTILGVPQSCDEITLLQWVKFNEIWDNAPEFVTKKDSKDWNEQEIIAYLDLQCNMLLKVCKVQLNDGNWYPCEEDDLLNLPSDNESDLSRAALCSTVAKMMNSYQPKELNTFVHKGKKFKVPENLRLSSRIAKHWINLRTIEAVEALQYEDVINQKKGTEENPYTIHDKLYHTDVGVMACVCRLIDDKTGKLEKMPTNFVKRRKLIEERIAFFSDVPMSIGCDVGFFLSDSNMISKLNLSLLNYTNLLQKMQKRGRKN